MISRTAVQRIDAGSLKNPGLKIFLTRRNNKIDIDINLKILILAESRRRCIDIYTAPVQPVTPVGGTVQIKQLIVVPDRVLCTRYFVL